MSAGNNKHRPLALDLVRFFFAAVTCGLAMPCKIDDLVEYSSSATRRRNPLGARPFGRPRQGQEQEALGHGTEGGAQGFEGAKGVQVGTLTAS